MDRPARASSPLLGRVRDLLSRPPVTCRPDLTADAVARLLSAERVGSVVVVDDDGAPLGIVTDRDLRGKVLAESRDPSRTSAAQVMSCPLVTIRPGAFAFEAVLEMTRRAIHHLVVVDGGRLVGVLSTQDFLMQQSAHPVVLAREIARATSVDALRPLGDRITAMVDRLVTEGATAYDIGQMVAELNDRIVGRALGFTADALADAGEEAPPVGYCWIALGSEARREQTLRSDQDNGLVYANPPPDLEERVAAYYTRFATHAVATLVDIGVPRCPGDSMASNPRWCQPSRRWAEYFRHWIEVPEPAQVLAASIYFDLRPVGGSAELVQPLLDVIAREAPVNRLFLGLLAREVVGRRVPFTMLGGIAVARSGAQRGMVDIKGAGALQLVGAARLHALELGLGETNTVDRLRAAGARGVYREHETREVTDAYQHLMRLRIVHQLEQLARGEAPDNFVRPDALSRADALLFRDALRTVQRVQAGIRERFGADMAG
jgi:CBS domain-containing protein